MSKCTDNTLAKLHVRNKRGFAEIDEYFVNIEIDNKSFVKLQVKFINLLTTYGTIYATIYAIY